MCARRQNWRHFLRSMKACQLLAPHLWGTQLRFAELSWLKSSVMILVLTMGTKIITVTRILYDNLCGLRSSQTKLILAKIDLRKKMPRLTFTNMMLWVYLTTLAPRVVARLLQFIGLPSPCYTSATAWECQQGCLKIAHSTSISPHRDVKISQIWQEFSACPYQAWLILSPDTKSWILGPLPTPRTFVFPETVS